jgi:hypothetical protein
VLDDLRYHYGHCRCLRYWEGGWHERSHMHGVRARVARQLVRALQTPPEYWQEDKLWAK